MGSGHDVEVREQSIGGEEKAQGQIAFAENTNQILSLKQASPPEAPSIQYTML